MSPVSEKRKRIMLEEMDLIKEQERDMARTIFNSVQDLITKYFVEQPDDFSEPADVEGFAKEFMKLKERFGVK